MAKLMKKEYNKLKSELQKKIADVERKLEVLNIWSNTLDYNNLSEDTKQKLLKIGDYWNGLHDKHYELEKELQFLEDRWDRRNWTGADWNSWELVINNID